MNTDSMLKAEHRKLRKVVVERQRRDRIERCLEQLKTILLQSDNSIQQQQQQQQAGTKLEKAELLEMTVAYVCRVQKDVSRQMSLGFASCMHEVDAFLAQSETGSEVDAELRTHLIRRLSRCRRHLGSAVFADQTRNCRRDADYPSSSSTSTSGSSLLPRKLCFDDAEQVRSVRGPALRDMNDNTRYTQLASGDVYRRPTAMTTGNENIDFTSGQQLDMASVGVDTISSTTFTLAQQGRSLKHSEGCSSSLCLCRSDAENTVAAFDLSIKQNLIVVNEEPLTPVWRPW